MCDDLHGTETMEQYFQVEVVVLLVTLSAETKGFVHKFNSKNKLAQKSKQCYVKILLILGVLIELTSKSAPYVLRF